MGTRAFFTDLRQLLQALLPTSAAASSVQDDPHNETPLKVTCIESRAYLASCFRNEGAVATRLRFFLNALACHFNHSDLLSDPSIVAIQTIASVPRAETSQWLCLSAAHITPTWFSILYCSDSHTVWLLNLPRLSNDQAFQ